MAQAAANVSVASAAGVAALPGPTTVPPTMPPSPAGAVHTGTPVAPAELPLRWQMAAGACGTSCAVMVSHPLEVIKARMQVDGELARGARQYRGFGHAARSIAMREGVRGLWSGIGPGVLFQVTMNGTRLGAFAPVLAAVTAATVGDREEASAGGDVARRIVVGAAVGVSAACLGSPFYLVKTRLQLQSAHFTTLNQHNYNSGVLGAFRSIVRQEGARGLMRGTTAQMLRVGVGSAVQLSTYESCKELVRESGVAKDGVPLYFASSLVSGFLLSLAMNPVDVVCTRMYNQGVSAGLYSSPVDCLVKMFRAEGVRGLYKGWLAQYARLAPHTTLTFICFEQFKNVFQEYLSGGSTSDESD